VAEQPRRLHFAPAGIVADGGSCSSDFSTFGGGGVAEAVGSGFNVGLP